MIVLDIHFTTCEWAQRQQQKGDIMLFRISLCLIISLMCGCGGSQPQKPVKYDPYDEKYLTSRDKADYATQMRDVTMCFQERFAYTRVGKGETWGTFEQFSPQEHVLDSLLKMNPDRLVHCVERLEKALWRKRDHPGLRSWFKRTYPRRGQPTLAEIKKGRKQMIIIYSAAIAELVKYTKTDLMLRGKRYFYAELLADYVDFFKKAVPQKLHKMPADFEGPKVADLAKAYNLGIRFEYDYLLKAGGGSRVIRSNRLCKLLRKPKMPKHGLTKEELQKIGCHRRASW